jgi:hypothetical protein
MGRHVRKQHLAGDVACRPHRGHVGAPVVVDAHPATFIYRHPGIGQSQCFCACSEANADQHAFGAHILGRLARLNAHCHAVTTHADTRD